MPGRSKIERFIAVTRLGAKYEVDHGETGCQTPDAVGYILKITEYRKKKAAK